MIVSVLFGAGFDLAKKAIQIIGVISQLLPGIRGVPVKDGFAYVTADMQFSGELIDNIGNLMIILVNVGMVSVDDDPIAGALKIGPIAVKNMF